MKVTVFGAARGTGRAIVKQLAHRDHEVTAASRSITHTDAPPGVHVAPTDLLDPAQADAASRDADVVVMAAHVPYQRWSTELIPLFDAALGAAERAGARLVLADNLYAYGSPGTPISTTTPESATSRKGRLRARAGQRLLAAHDAGRVPVSIGRFSDYYGPHAPNSLLHMLQIGPASRGRAARSYIDAGQPHTFHYLPDAARGFATLIERPESAGSVWVLPAAPAVTQNDIIGHLENALGRSVKRGHISPLMLRIAGLVNAQLREAYELTDQWDRPYTTDASAFEDAFGPVPTTPHADAIRATVDAARDEHPSKRSA